MSKKISELTLTANPIGALLPADLAGADVSVVVGQANGLASLAADGTLLPAQIPSATLGQVIYQGLWNANGVGPPTLNPAKGFYYIVSTAGSTTLNGITDWKVGDWAIYNGAAWDKVDNTDAVSSVAGLIGVITAAALSTALGLDAKAPLASPEFTGSRPTHGGLPMGLRDLPQTLRNSTSTFALADAGTTVLKNSSSALTWTIPPNSSVAFPLGAMITCRNMNAAGVLTLARGSGVVLRKAGSGTDANLSLAAWGLITLVKEATNDWVATGTGI